MKAFVARKGISPVKPKFLQAKSIEFGSFSSRLQPLCRAVIMQKNRKMRRAAIAGIERKRSKMDTMVAMVDLWGGGRTGDSFLSLILLPVARPQFTTISWLARVGHSPIILHTSSSPASNTPSQALHSIPRTTQLFPAKTNPSHVSASHYCRLH